MWSRNCLPFRSTPICSGVRGTRSLVLCVVFCRSLFVPLCFFAFPLYCLSFFNLRILIVPCIFKLLLNKEYLKRTYNTPFVLCKPIIWMCSFGEIFISFSKSEPRLSHSGHFSFIRTNL